MPDITPEKAEAEYSKIVAYTTPGSGDMKAAQAAACAAKIIAKIYDADLTGYTAQTSFLRNALPDSGSWTVIFYHPRDSKMTQDEEIFIPSGYKSYIAAMDSVTGVIQSAYCDASARGATTSSNLDDASWIVQAQDYTKKLMPDGVTITGSRAVMKSTQDGVSVVCSLSDGSAFGIRLMGDSKVAAVIIYYSNGYDGSMDYKPITEGGVG